MEHCLQNERGERRREPSTPAPYRSFLPLMRYHSISLALSFLSLVPFSVSRPPALMSLEYSSRVFVLSHLPSAVLCGDTRTTKLLIALPRRAFTSRERERFPAACVTRDKRGHAQIVRSN